MTAPYYDRHGVTVHAGDCLDVLATMPDASIDAVVCDPPYGLGDHKPAAIVTALTAWANGERDMVPSGRGFMGRDWDAFVPPPAVWDECLRVLKPGGHLVAFAGSRTYDLMGLSIRMAGFEIRDGLSWVYGSGFPKSLDVSKAIDKAAGVERQVVGTKLGQPGYSLAPSTGEHRTYGRGIGNTGDPTAECTITAPATDGARQWSGWGTALKPAQEPIVLARKPLVGTVAATVLAHGTGGLNVDACRTEGAPRTTHADGNRQGTHPAPMDWGAATGHVTPGASGRWPANVLFSHGEACADECVPGCPVAELDAQSGIACSSGVYSGDGSRRPSEHATDFGGGHRPATMYADQGGASRFFPVFRWEAKAPTSERPQVDGVAHPTVKPLDLMRWLVRLVTPPGGLVLDPFAGSGTTLHAARAEGFRAIGIERESAYLPLIKARLDARARTATAPAVPVPDGEPMDLLDLIGDAS